MKRGEGRRKESMEKKKRGRKDKKDEGVCACKVEKKGREERRKRKTGEK